MQIPPFMQRDSPVALHTATSVSQNTPSNKIDAKWRFSVPVRTSNTLILVAVRHDGKRCTFLLIKYYIVMGTVWDSIVGIVTCYRLLVQGITGQISKLGTRTPLREYNAWWSQEMLSIYRLNNMKDNCG